MILYFSGTGNSKYVANALSSQLADELVCMNDYIKQGEQGTFCSGKPWVFVFPVYLSTIPEIVVKFLRNAQLSGCKESYFVGTCASAVGATPNVANRLCKEKGLQYKGAARIVMPQNYIALFTMTEEAEIEKRIVEAEKRVEEISTVIQKKEILEMPPVSKFEYGAVKVVEKLYNGHFTKTGKFFTTDACVGCSLCEKVCPVNNIVMADKKPRWQGSCLHCMSCINRCPKQAIEYGKNTAGKTRYICREYETHKK